MLVSSRPIGFEQVFEEVMQFQHEIVHVDVVWYQMLTDTDLRMSYL